MGCDIHIYKEKLVNGVWVSSDKWTPYDYGDGESGMTVEYDDRVYRGRNYQLFGIISRGVRGFYHEISLEPKGMPLYASSEVKREADDWELDAHSHSYLTLKELNELKKKASESSIEIEGMKDRESLDALQKTIDSGNPNWDLIFPYCGWGNSPNLVPFKINVPASFYIGNCLEKIINGLDANAEDQRIVFFFDN